jgi:hypothetical protein
MQFERVSNTGASTMSDEVSTILTVVVIAKTQERQVVESINHYLSVVAMQADIGLTHIDQ